MVRRLAAWSGAVALGLLTVGMPGDAPASHGMPVEGIVIDFLGLRPSEDIGGACRVDGVARNRSTLTLTVRVRYRAETRDRQISHATARLTRVEPGEERPFASTPFRDADERATATPCGELRRVEMVEAVAEPAP
jgi:hypothetical protein